MNTTKTLEAVKKEARKENGVLNQLVREGVGSPGCARVLEKTDEFAEKIWNAALDACMEKLEATDVFLTSHIEAIDSLRTGGGKE